MNADDVIEEGQIRQHTHSGLRFRVLEPDGPDRWAVAYLPPDVPRRGRNRRSYDARSIVDYYPVVEASGDE